MITVIRVPATAMDKAVDYAVKTFKKSDTEGYGLNVGNLESRVESLEDGE